MNATRLSLREIADAYPSQLFLFTPEEIATWLGVPARVVHRMIRTGLVDSLQASPRTVFVRVAVGAPQLGRLYARRVRALDRAHGAELARRRKAYAAAQGRRPA